MSVEILIVIVTYKTNPLESTTVTSLLGCSDCFGGKFRVLIYDNSPTGVDISIGDDFEYFASDVNKGLACAYNYGLRRAIGLGANLLVTLDQDSFVSREYIGALSCIVVDKNGPVASYCPEIYSSGRRISPFYFNRKGLPCFDDKKNPSEAINSFSAYSVRHLVEIGGFDEFYWLDALDSSTFVRILNYGWRVERIPVVVLHDLSVVSGKISLWRLKNIATYESSFLFEYNGFVRIISGLIRIIFRSFRLLSEINEQVKFCLIFLCIFRGMVFGVWRRLFRKRSGWVL